MKATSLRKKFDTINKAIASQIEKLSALADEFDDPEVSDLIGEYVEKLEGLVITDEDCDTSASVILDYIDNELIPVEAENKEYE